MWHLDIDCSWNGDTPTRTSNQAAGTWEGERNVTLQEEDCERQNWVLPLVYPYMEQTKVVSDFYWLYEGRRLRATLQKKLEGNLYKSKSCAEDFNY